jgi:ABC-type phosphate transport system substrate-binding protein
LEEKMSPRVCKSFYPAWIAFFAFICCSLPGVASAGALDSFAGLEGTIDIAGGTAHIPVMTDAAKNIMSFNPKIRITVEGGGSGVGVQKVGEGLVSIGNTGRALSEEEIAKYGLKTYPFAQDKDAIGYAGIGHVDQSVKGIVIDGIVSSQENAMNGSYPVVRKLYMNTKGDPQKLVKTFIEYIMGPDGAVIIARSGYLPLKQEVGER